MKTSVRMLAMAALGLALLATTGCSKLRARDQLNKGVQSYKNAKYEEAINHFQQAVSLDPTLLNARLYLATAFAQQYIPGVDAEDNNRMGQNAIDQYEAVLERDPSNINSVKGIAYLYLQMKKFDDAKDYYRKAVTADPNDPEPYYSVGVIDNLDKALKLRPDYDDATAYLNLMYRERADVQCDDPAARAADLKTADERVDKTMAVKKAKAEKQPTNTGITMD